MVKIAKFASRKLWKILLSHCFYYFLKIGKLIALIGSRDSYLDDLDSITDQILRDRSANQNTACRGSRQEEQAIKGISHKISLSTATTLAMILGSYLYSASADAADVRDISKINSGITVEAEDRVGDVSTINGGIRLDYGANAQEVATVNGGIGLEDGVVVVLAESVNGGIRVGENVTVNGGIRTAAGTVVEDRVVTVNGRVRLHNTQVGRDVQSSNGNIEIREGSAIEGDIIIKGRRRWWDRLFGFSRRPPEITIDSSSTVRGDIHLHRQTELNIADGAEVGEIIEHY